jgi:transposase
MRRGFTGLSGMVQTVLEQNPLSGQVFIFRGRRGDLVKLFGTMAMVFACSRRDWTVDASYGRRPPRARYC